MTQVYLGEKKTGIRFYSLVWDTPPQSAHTKLNNEVKEKLLDYVD
ncbi:8563_t:CDS:1, partial [Funneliformis geosporum]